MAGNPAIAAVDPRDMVGDGSLRWRQVVVIAICVLLNALDGFDVLAISFASPGIAAEWGIDRAALGVVLSMELIGMAAGSEVPVDGDSILNVDALVSFATSFSRYDSPKANISFGVLLFPELNHWGRVRSNANARFKYELLKDFTVATTLYNTYDNEPPVTDASHNDIGVTFSIGWTF